MSIAGVLDSTGNRRY